MLRLSALQRRRLGGDEPTTEPGHHEPTRHRLLHQQRPQVPMPSEPRSRIHPERPTAGRPHLRSTEPADTEADNRRHHRSSDSRAQPVERRPRQRLGVRRRPGSGRCGQVRRQATGGVSSRREGDPLGRPGQQQRQCRSCPHDPDDQQRSPGQHEDQDLEHPKPIAFHTQVSRETPRKPRSSLRPEVSRPPRPAP